MHFFTAIYDEIHPFNALYPEATYSEVDSGYELEREVDQPILVIWGGSDIHPSLYNRPNMGSYASKEPSIRDRIEKDLFETAVKLKIPIIGICRGAQLGCALSGGILVQDVPNHTRGHMILTTEDPYRVIRVNSLHHQMMFPWKINHVLLARSDPLNQSAENKVVYAGLDEEELALMNRHCEPEAVYFPDTKCLGVQWHPEMMDADTKANLYFKELIDACILA